MKINLNYLLITLITIVVSCKKEPIAKDKEPYAASPQQLIDLTGSSWTDNEPKFRNKKDYLYTESQNGFSGPPRISLSAIEKTFPDVEYNMLMNVSGLVPIAGNIAVVSIVTKDSLRDFSKEKAYNLMLYYYNEGLSAITDTIYTSSSYTLPNGTFISSTQKEIIEKLNSGYDVSKFSIGYKSASKGYITIELTKGNSQSPYYFSFYSYIL